MARADLKFIIAGGGVAGLSLANMLEMADIDYTVLESHHEIAPQTGASIGLFPNGLRILDQIGVYEEIRQSWGHHPMSNTTRGVKGNVICATPAMGDRLQEKHGYPFIFIDRQYLLQVLYDNLKHKDRVITGRKVSKVIMDDHSVRVATIDGGLYTGTVLIGADGIHSRVRDEMWRIGHEQEPGSFADDRNKPLSCNYMCVFGISQLTEPFDSNHLISGYGSSYLISPGPGRRVYWFLFINVGGTVQGSAIPRYTKEDEAILVALHGKDQITETLTFADLYKGRIYSHLTPLVEHIFERWHFGRIMTIGDSAHKLHPIAGQGGMSAIESAAALVNGATQLDKPILSNLDWDRVFADVQAVRNERVMALLKGANTQQRLLANDHPMSALFPPFLGLFGGLSFDLRHLEKRVVGGVSLQGFPTPYRAREILFTDELPASTPSRMSPGKFILRSIGLVLLLLAQAVKQMLSKASSAMYLERSLLSSGVNAQRGLDTSHKPSP